MTGCLSKASEQSFLTLKLKERKHEIFSYISNYSFSILLLFSRSAVDDNPLNDHLKRTVFSSWINFDLNIFFNIK
jgi:hypothetical protein